MLKTHPGTPKLRQVKDRKVTEGESGKCKKMWVSEGQERTIGLGNKIPFFNLVLFYCL